MEKQAPRVLQPPIDSESTLKEEVLQFLQPTTETDKKETSIMNLTLQVETLKGDVAHWKQRTIRAEEINEHSATEVSAIYKGRGDFKDAAIEYLLAAVSDANDIEAALTSLTRHKYPRELRWGTPIIAIAILLFLYLNPKISKQILVIASSPSNQIFIAFCLIVVLGIVYYWRRKKR